MDKSIYKKMQANSCVLLGDNIYFYTVLGDLMEFNIKDSSIRLLGEVLCEMIPSIYSIFAVRNKLYYINNNDYNIYDQFGNICVVIKELCNLPNFIYCSHQDDKYINIIDGNGHLYKNINVMSGEYETCYIKDLIYAKSLSDRMVWVDKRNNIEAYIMKTNEIIRIGRLNCDGEIEAICCDSDNNYYFLDNKGDIYLCDAELGSVKRIIGIGERKYIDINYVDGNIVAFPKLSSNKIVCINPRKTNQIAYIEYPEDAFFFANSVVMFSRYAENDKYIIYPMRGLDYFLIINKKSLKTDWIRPCFDNEFKIDTKEKVDKFGENIQEGALTLSDFIDGVVKK